MQYISGSEFQRVIFYAGYRAPGSHLKATGQSTSPHSVFLQRSAHAPPTQLRINAERLDVPLVENRAVVRHGRPSLFGADYLNQVAQEPRTSNTLKGR